MITIVGIGPGHPGYITPAALKRLRDADVLIGGKRVLSTIDTTGKEIHHVTADVEATIKVIGKNAERNLAIVVGGDPGFYSILKTIRERLPELELDVIPGISSFQLLFSLMGSEWQDVTLVSVHGRSVDELRDAVSHNKKVCVLTDEKLTASEVCRYLRDIGVKGRAVVGKKLSYPDQELVDATIDEIAVMDGFGSSVLYIERV